MALRRVGPQNIDRTLPTAGGSPEASEVAGADATLPPPPPSSTTFPPSARVTHRARQPLEPRATLAITLTDQTDARSLAVPPLVAAPGQRVQITYERTAAFWGEPLRSSGELRLIDLHYRVDDGPWQKIPISNGEQDRLTGKYLRVPATFTIPAEAKHEVVFRFDNLAIARSAGDSNDGNFYRIRVASGEEPAALHPSIADATAAGVATEVQRRFSGIHPPDAEVLPARYFVKDDRGNPVPLSDAYGQPLTYIRNGARIAGPRAVVLVHPPEEVGDREAIAAGMTCHMVANTLFDDFERWVGPHFDWPDGAPVRLYAFGKGHGPMGVNAAASLDRYDQNRDGKKEGMVQVLSDARVIGTGDLHPGIGARDARMVAHEVGHIGFYGILSAAHGADLHRLEIAAYANPVFGAVHEATGDITGLLFELGQPESRRQLLAKTNGDLMQPNALGRTGQLRDFTEGLWKHLVDKGVVDADGVHAPRAVEYLAEHRLGLEALERDDKRASLLTEALAGPFLHPLSTSHWTPEAERARREQLLAQLRSVAGDASRRAWDRYCAEVLHRAPAEVQLEHLEAAFGLELGADASHTYLPLAKLLLEELSACAGERYGAGVVGEIAALGVGPGDVGKWLGPEIVAAGAARIKRDRALVAPVHAEVIRREAVAWSNTAYDENVADSPGARVFHTVQGLDWEKFEPHAAGVPLTSAFYAVLADIVGAEIAAGTNPEQALLAARERLASVYFRALERLPAPASIGWGEVVQAILAQARAAAPPLEAEWRRAFETRGFFDFPRWAISGRRLTIAEPPGRKTPLADVASRELEYRLNGGPVQSARFDEHGFASIDLPPHARGELEAWVHIRRRDGSEEWLNNGGAGANYRAPVAPPPLPGSIIVGVPMPIHFPGDLPVPLEQIAHAEMQYRIRPQPNDRSDRPIERIDMRQGVGSLLLPAAAGKQFLEAWFHIRDKQGREHWLSNGGRNFWAQITPEPERMPS